MKDKKQFNFWDVEFGDYSKQSVHELIKNLLSQDSENQRKATLIATVNPEMLLLSDNDEYYKKTINSFDLKIIDGFGIRLVNFFKKKQLPERVAGVELAGHVLKEAIKNGKSTVFVFKKQGLSKKSDIENFIKKLGTENIEIIEYDICKTDDIEYDQEIKEKMQNKEVMLVGLGMPHQENFIYKNFSSCPKLKIAIGVGGTFDFWCGKQKRAPKLLQKIGMEWFWRLVTRPKRFVRIWKSTGVFMFKSLLKS